VKCNWANGLLMAAILTAPAYSQVSVYIGIAPPPIRYEAPPPPPAPDFVWVDGFWAPQGHHYRWVAGHYERPPFPGGHWSHPHYDRYPEGWQYHEGHWDREDHDHDHGHAYGHDRDRGEDHDHDHGHGD
jgi:WXXGXW repeat (2 copies)